jgi:hypothetical protein
LLVAINQWNSYGKDFMGHILQISLTAKDNKAEVIAEEIT